MRFAWKRENKKAPGRARENMKNEREEAARAVTEGSGREKETAEAGEKGGGERESCHRGHSLQGRRGRRVGLSPYGGQRTVALAQDRQSWREKPNWHK